MLAQRPRLHPAPHVCFGASAVYCARFFVGNDNDDAQIYVLVVVAVYIGSAVVHSCVVDVCLGPPPVMYDAR